MEIAGVDSDGREFKSAEEMWRAEIGDGSDPTKKIDWYRQGVGYWEVRSLLPYTFSSTFSRQPNTI